MNTKTEEEQAAVISVSRILFEQVLLRKNMKSA